MTDHMTEQAQTALMYLYEQAKHTTDNFTLERIDRALDEVVRLNSTSQPEWQVRSAMANAYKVIRHRRCVVSPASLEARQVDVQFPNGAEDVIDLQEWLHGTPRFTSEQRTLLLLLADDRDPVDLAHQYGVPVSRMREKVSRIRRVARTAYRDDLSAA